MAEKPGLITIGAMLIQNKIVSNKDHRSKLDNEAFELIVNNCRGLIELPQTPLAALKRISEILIHLYMTTSSRCLTLSQGFQLYSILQSHCQVR